MILPQQPAVCGRAPVMAPPKGDSPSMGANTAYNAPNFYRRALDQAPVWARDEYFNFLHEKAVKCDLRAMARIPQNLVASDFLKRSHDLKQLSKRALESVNVGEQDPPPEASQAVMFALRRAVIKYNRAQPFNFFDSYMQYTHTISGQQAGSLDGIFSGDDTELVQADSASPWLIRYCIGSLDPDAGNLLHVFGELFIPVDVATAPTSVNGAGPEDVDCGCNIR